MDVRGEKPPGAFQCGEQKVQRLWVGEHAGSTRQEGANWGTEDLIRDEARKVGRDQILPCEPGKNFSLYSKNNGWPLKSFKRGRHWNCCKISFLAAVWRMVWRGTRKKIGRPLEPVTKAPGTNGVKWMSQGL